MMKRAVYILLLLILATGIWHRALIYYGYVQAKGQLDIVFNARPVEEFLQDPNTPDSIISKLRLVEEVRNFAFDELGIEYSDNYTSMFDQKGKPLMWVVSGSEPFALKPYMWGFPIVGTFPYKGFFDPDMAVAERDRLMDEGYDSGIRNAGGWSTLGWLDDPILSEMLKREEGQLAELIIHELTHFTLFVKDSVEFNENLASFVGKQGAIQFLKGKFGSDSEELQTYLRSEEDYDKFVKYFIDGAQRLDSLYLGFPDELSDDQKIVLKNTLINDIVEGVDSLQFHQPERFHKKIRSENVNNTYFLSYLRYRSKQDIFMIEFENQHYNNVRSFIEHYKSIYPAN